MTKKQAKKLLKSNPDFETWLKKDPARAALVRSKPSEAKGLLSKYEASKTRRRSIIPTVDFQALSTKTRSVNEKLTNVQAFLDLMMEHQGKFKPE